MAVVIAGGTGFLGAPLAAALAREHEVVVLTRTERATKAGIRFVPWVPDGAPGPWADVVSGARAVINLAGEPIAGKRWTSDQKQRILDSRLQATSSLVRAIEGASTPPPVFISASAVGYYGPLGDEVVTEEHPPGTDFLARVCVEWETAALRASPRTRVVLLRTGIVLERDGGALPKMLPPFRVGAGGPVGTGRQYWPWIHRQDWIDLVRFAIATTSVSGAVNATAPTPVTNRDFALALGRAMRRPAVLPAPAFALKLLLGEMAHALLLSGQRVVPEKPQRLGFAFAYPHLEPALGAIFRRDRV